MVITANYPVKPIGVSKLGEVDFANLQFGKTYSDHMLRSYFSKGEWGNTNIGPYENLSFSPANAVLHYSQTIFEGMKAHRSAEGEILLFRPDANFARMNKSAERMCMPAISEEIFMGGLKQLVDIDRKWVPGLSGTSLYLRPLMFAIDEYIGVRPSEDYLFMIFTSPVGAYYSKPVRVKIETEFTRASPGGVGFAKTGGNYAASLYPAKLAAEQGYDQLIWTDGAEHKYIEEAGTMNLMLVIDGKILTASTGTDTILKGITRDSVLTLAREWGITIEERDVSVAEIVDALEDGRVSEAFGVGTAATISQIATIGFEGKDYDLPAIEGREISNRFLKTLDGIKTGKIADTHNWIVKV